MTKEEREEKIEYIHRKIDAFADLMKDRMEANIHKGTAWREMHFAELFFRAVEELGELSAGLMGRGMGGKMQVACEAADVSNLLMMIVDVVWGLDDEDPVPLEQVDDDKAD